MLKSKAKSLPNTLSTSAAGTAGGRSAGDMLQRYEIIREFFGGQVQAPSHSKPHLQSAFHLQARRNANATSWTQSHRHSSKASTRFQGSNSFSSNLITSRRHESSSSRRAFSGSSRLREDDSGRKGPLTQQGKKEGAESQGSGRSIKGKEVGNGTLDVTGHGFGNGRPDRVERNQNSNSSKPYPNQPYHNYPRSLRELALRAFDSNPNTSNQRDSSRQTSRNLNATSNQSSNSNVNPSSANRSNYNLNLPQCTLSNKEQYPFSPSSSRDGSLNPSSSLHASNSQSSTSLTSSPTQSTWARPTKEDLLNLAHGFWTRARIRFKWFTIRGFRRFNVDDLSAFFTLGGLGTILFIVVGTTTAVSVVFAGLNLLNMQEWIARKLADYLTAETGVTVVFESAIVPKWKDSRISFKNVFISRRAHGGDIDSLLKERKALAERKMASSNSQSGSERSTPSKSSSSIFNWIPFWSSSASNSTSSFLSNDGNSAEEILENENASSSSSSNDKRKRKKRNWRTAATAGQGMAWEGTHYEEDEEVAPPMSDSSTGNFHDGDSDSDSTSQEVNNNFTMFDLNVDSIDVTLSFKRWWNGMGIIEDAVIKGVRGIVDRRNVHWDPSVPYDPRAHRRTASHGDFHLESLVVEDFLVTVYQPFNFRPFNFSIFQASIPKLRKQWLFYDLLSADSITGQVDGCLMSLHKPQTIGRTNEAEQEREQTRGGRWKTLSRFRVDGVNIDHIQNQSDLSGPLSWIISSRFDVVADFKFPKDLSDDVDINAIISEIVENLTIAVSGDPFPYNAEEGEEGPIPGQSRLSGPAIEAPVTTVGPRADQARIQDLKEKEKIKEKNKVDNDWRESRRKKWRERIQKIRDRRKGVDEGDKSDSGEGEDGIGEKAALEASEDQNEEVDQNGKAALPTPSVVIDMDVRFKDTKAAVPLFTRDISYTNNAFVRPIVAFMNAHKTLIPVHCRIVMDLSEFDGSIDLAQTGLLPLVSEKIHEALANHVASQNANQQRLKSVSLWSLQKVANTALRFLRSNIQNDNSAAAT